MSSQSDVLEITNQTLRFSNQIIQMRNITRVGKYTIRQRWKILVGLLVPVVAVGSLVVMTDQRTDPDRIAVLVVGGVILVVLILLLLKKKTFALLLETSSSSKQLFTTKDGPFMDELVDTIGEVLDNQEKPANYTVNIRSAKIEDHSVRETVMGDKYENVHGSQIKSPGATLTYINESQLSNALNTVQDAYGDDVEEALRVLAEHIRHAESREAGELLNSFNTEVSKPEANRTTLKVLWNGLCDALPDAAKVAASVATIAKALML